MKIKQNKTLLTNIDELEILYLSSFPKEERFPFDNLKD